MENAEGRTDEQGKPNTSYSSAARVMTMKQPEDLEVGTTRTSHPEKCMKLQDFTDLFATLIVSLPLTTHRHLLKRVPLTFTSEEALTNLSNLRFSQSNRMPDPKDPSKIITATTTTSFSMAKEMARSVCNRFIEARLISAAVDSKASFNSRSSLWTLTAKGIYLVRIFCQRNGINQGNVMNLLESTPIKTQIVMLERDSRSDKLYTAPDMIEVIFSRFASNMPNTDALHTDADGVHVYVGSAAGVRVLGDKKIGDKLFYNVFNGLEALNWIMSCTSVIDKREGLSLFTLFIKNGLVQSCVPSETAETGASILAKNAFFIITEKGQRLVGWISKGRSESSPPPPVRVRDGLLKDTSANRLTQIINDPALRLLFAEHLRESLCSENLQFYLDCESFLEKHDKLSKLHESNVDGENIPHLLGDAIAHAFHIYNTFLALGAPNELNLEHSIRSDLSATMTLHFAGPESSNSKLGYLDNVARLYQQASASVSKLMASDSVPKFLKDPKYLHALKEREP